MAASHFICPHSLHAGVPTDRQKPSASLGVEVIALPVVISTCIVFCFVCAVFSFNVQICMVRICLQYSVLFRRSAQLFACELVPDRLGAAHIVEFWVAQYLLSDTTPACVLRTADWICVSLALAYFVRDFATIVL